MPLTDDEYQFHARVIAAAAKMHPDDCLVTPNDIARGLRDADQWRAKFSELRAWAAAQQAGR